MAGIGRVRAEAGSVDEAKALYERAIGILEEADPVALRIALNDLGELETDLGHYDAAHALLERARMLAEAEQAWSDVAGILHALGDLALDQGDAGAAIALYKQALDLVRASPRGATTAYCLAGIAAATATRGNAEIVDVLWHTATTLEDELGFRITPTHRRRYRTHVVAFAPPTQRFTLDEVIELALSLD
jgi:tetratricopeptide (TPR) repeat protein